MDHCPSTMAWQYVQLSENHLANTMISVLTAVPSLLPLMNVLTTWHPTQQRIGYMGCSGYTVQGQKMMETDTRVQWHLQRWAHPYIPWLTLFHRPQILHSGIQHLISTPSAHLPPTLMPSPTRLQPINKCQGFLIGSCRAITRDSWQKCSFSKSWHSTGFHNLTIPLTVILTALPHVYPWLPQGPLHMWNSQVFPQFSPFLFDNIGKKIYFLINFSHLY